MLPATIFEMKVTPSLVQALCMRFCFLAARARKKIFASSGERFSFMKTPRLFADNLVLALYTAFLSQKAENCTAALLF